MILPIRAGSVKVDVRTKYIFDVGFVTSALTGVLILDRHANKIKVLENLHHFLFAHVVYAGTIGLH